MIEKTVWHLKHYPVTTMCAMMPEEQQKDPNTVKLVRAADKCLWFGRGIVGYGDWHLGIYGYRRNALEMYPGLISTREERLEGLEQLRWLKGGWDIGVFPCEFNGIEINTPADAERWHNDNSR
jgi:3-deoxy-manno-octulosonate cytidylyltransferase (CMP-KDO synthetase)